MQAYSLVADDIMDSSITRRGQLCWYRLDGVGLAISNVLVMKGAIFQIIRKHFRTEPFYVDLNDLMREVCLPPILDESHNQHVQVLYQTEMGQLVDLLTAQNNNVDLSKFSLARFLFFLPIS
jgi:farnesyl diphosphate synthase